MTQTPEHDLPRTPAAPPPPTGRLREDRPLAGILMMCAVSLIFAIQDGLSRQLGAAYPPVLIVMIRFWVFAGFVMLLVSRQPGGIRAALRSRRPFLQILRGLLLVAEVVVMVEAFVRLGLVETHAVFTAYPLLVAALSGPVLGEKVGWRRWAAIGVGFVGIVVILNPGGSVFAPAAILPLIAAAMFAVYGLLTRLVARDDSAMVSFFWTGMSGALAISVVGLRQWEWLAPMDWVWMAGLCLTSISSHYLLIRAYEVAEASVLQPFAYTQLVWVSLIGVLVFGETLRLNVAVGAAIVVGAGIFTLWRAQVRARADRRAAARAAASAPAP